MAVEVEFIKNDIVLFVEVRAHEELPVRSRANLWWSFEFPGWDVQNLCMIQWKSCCEKPQEVGNETWIPCIIAPCTPHRIPVSKRTFLVLGVRHMICKCVPRSMNNYKCKAVWHHVDAQQLLCIAWLRTSQSFIAHQYTPLLTLLDRHMPPMETNAAYLPACELHSHDSRYSLSSVTASKFIVIDCTWKSCDLEIVHMIIMQSLDWLRNLEIGMQS